MTDSIIFYADKRWESPYVFSVYVALKEKGLAFEERALDLKRGDQREAGFRARSLTARVPCIEHGDFVLSESLAIVEYIDELVPSQSAATQALMPSERKARARARQVLGWLRSDLLALREARPSSTFFYGRATTTLEGNARHDAQKLIDIAEQLVPKAEGALFGQWSIVDADLAFMLHRLIFNGDVVPERIARYATAQWQRPSVQAFLAHPRAATAHA